MSPDPAVAVTRDALSNYFPDGKFAGRLQLLPEYNCVYVKNAKAASSTITLWLHRIHTGDHQFTPDLTIHKEHKLPRPQQIGWDKVLRMLAGDAFRFSFVRDPIRRAESAYLNKVADPRRPDRWRAQLRETLGLTPAPGSAVTFDQFVAALELQDPLEMNAHWRPQHLNLMHGLIEYDLVGRLESFARDLARVCEATGLPDLPITTRNVVAADRQDSLFDGRPDLLRRMRDIYARDLELFGY